MKALKPSLPQPLDTLNLRSHKCDGIPIFGQINKLLEHNVKALSKQLLSTKSTHMRHKHKHKHVYHNVLQQFLEKHEGSKSSLGIPSFGQINKLLEHNVKALSKQLLSTKSTHMRHKHKHVYHNVLKKFKVDSTTICLPPPPPPPTPKLEQNNSLNEIEHEKQEGKERIPLK